MQTTKNLALKSMEFDDENNKRFFKKEKTRKKKLYGSHDNESSEEEQEQVDQMDPKERLCLQYGLQSQRKIRSMQKY